MKEDTKKSASTAKPAAKVKVKDIAPKKDATGGRGHHDKNHLNKSRPGGAM